MYNVVTFQVREANQAAVANVRREQHVNVQGDALENHAQGGCAGVGHASAIRRNYVQFFTFVYPCPQIDCQIGRTDTAGSPGVRARLHVLPDPVSVSFLCKGVAQSDFHVIQVRTFMWI